MAISLIKIYVWPLLYLFPATHIVIAINDHTFLHSNIRQHPNVHISQSISDQRYSYLFICSTIFIRRSYLKCVRYAQKCQAWIEAATRCPVSCSTAWSKMPSLSTTTEGGTKTWDDRHGWLVGGGGWGRVRRQKKKTNNKKKKDNNGQL